MNFSKEYLTSIFTNLISDIIWCIISTAVSVMLGYAPIKIFEIEYFWGIIISAVLLALFIGIYIKIHNKLQYIKWDFLIKENVYELKLKDDGTAHFSQKYTAKVCLENEHKLTGSYDWSDADKITNAQVESKFSKWKLLYKARNSSIYEKDETKQGVKKITPDEKEIDYIIEYSDDSVSNFDNIENEVKVDFIYDKDRLKNEFFAGIKHPVRKLTLRLYASDSVL